ncbi:hypothetical protein C4D60_Mb07t08800 [Musa balbisiana]|uniref:Uncharacterized protein n=1 Tax=Musa balbisiana TaxID=52838 RepID=A0A4S8JFU4_MUSBA|nr:hypothetical protein C4D60_Mb07t08800 [Musa balbisiana]
MQSDTSDPNDTIMRPPYCSTPYRSTPDTPEPLRKTRDGIARQHCTASTRATPLSTYWSVNAYLQSTSYPPEESIVVKRSCTTNRFIIGIKASSLINERGLRTFKSLLFYFIIT